MSEKLSVSNTVKRCNWDEDSAIEDSEVDKSSASSQQSNELAVSEAQEEIGSKDIQIEAKA